MSVTLDSTEVQPCIPPVQQPPCSRGSARCDAQSAATENNDDDDGGNSSSTPRNALLDTLADDVYSYTVTCAVQGERGCKMFKAVLAMLFTFALQMGLLVLLWQAVVTGSATKVSIGTPANDKLWRQVGQVQRQVCWLTQHAIINVTAADDGSCSGAWVDGRSCIEYAQAPMGYLELKHCLETLASRPTPRRFDVSEPQLKEQQEAARTVEQACKQFGEMDSSQQAFAKGLLFPDFMPSGRDYRVLSNAFWHLGSPTVGPDFRAQRYSNSSPWNSNEGCIPPLEYALAQSPILVNVLACLALATYVHHEVMQAIWLGCVSAACCGILPAFYTTDLCRRVYCGRLGVCKKVVMLAAPVLQQVAAIAVLVSSMGLTFITETQSSVVLIILGNVALSFILDLDNRVGVMLKTQAMRDSDRQLISPTRPLKRARGGLKHLAQYADVWAASGVCIRFWGHVYTALLGFLLLAEPLFLAPATAWTIYAQLTLLQTQSAQQTAVSDWTSYAAFSDFFMQMYFGRLLSTHFDVATSLLWSLRIAGNRPDWFVAFQVLYPCALGVFVFLLYSNTLIVTVARRWNPVLLTVQVIIAACAGNSLTGLACLAVGWFGLFVLWPLLHRDPRDCCKGCSCCGCPKCQECCPGECCCAC